MSDKWTFEAAAAFWRQHSRADPETVWDRFVSAEAFLLDHKPGSSLEADIIIEILLEQCPGRSDDRDRRALQRLRTFIRGLPQALAAA